MKNQCIRDVWKIAYYKVQYQKCTTSHTKDDLSKAFNQYEFEHFPMGILHCHWKGALGTNGLRY